MSQDAPQTATHWGWQGGSREARALVLSPDTRALAVEQLVMRLLGAQEAEARPARDSD